MRLAERDDRGKTMRIRGHCVTAGFVNPTLVMPALVPAMTKIITEKLSRFFIPSLPGLTRQSMMTVGRKKIPVRLSLAEPHHGCAGQARA
jgi:hypothetical protein